MTSVDRLMELTDPSGRQHVQHTDIRPVDPFSGLKWRTSPEQNVIDSMLLRV